MSSEQREDFADGVVTLELLQARALCFGLRRSEGGL